jgi:hypothetical protein
MKKIGVLLLCSLLIGSFSILSGTGYVDAQSATAFEINEIGQMATAAWAGNIHVQGDIAYLSASDAGLYVVNISNPENPVELGRYNESIVDIHGFYVEDDLAYLADYTGGLKIVDVSDYTNLTLVGAFNDGGEVGALKIHDNLAFLADFQDGLEVVNISDPAHPYELAQYDQNISYIFNVEIINDLAYVSDFISASEKALIILNISDLSSIEEIARYTVDGEIFSIESAGGVAYMMCSYGGVKIFNISNPEALVEIGSFYDGGNAVDADFYEDYLVVADRDDGVEVLTADNPISITKIGHYFDGGSASDVDVVGNLIFVADGEDGLEILRIRASGEATDPLFIMLLIVSAGAVAILGIVIFMKHRQQ